MSFGVIVNERTAPSATGAPIDTGQSFVTGPVDNPVSEAVPCSSTNDYEAEFGPRGSTNTAVWDWLDVSFREGLSKAYVGGYAQVGDYAQGLALFDSRLGPGQLSILEPSSPTLYQDMQAHVDANNRIGLLDVGDQDTLAELEGHGTNAQGLANMENVGVFGSWVTCAGPPGTTASGGREVPASAVI